MELLIFFSSEWFPIIYEKESHVLSRQIPDLMLVK